VAPVIELLGKEKDVSLRREIYHWKRQFFRHQGGASRFQNQICLVLTLVQLILLGILTAWVSRHPIPAKEAKVTEKSFRNEPSYMRTLVTALSTLIGSPWLALPAGGIAAMFWKARLRVEAVTMTCLIATSTSLRLLLKSAIHRPRPNIIELHRRHKSSSFPSGHVTTSVTFWGWLIVVGMHLFKGKCRSYRRVLAVPATFIALIGPTRVYLGEHWLTDTLGGYLFGGACLSAAIPFYRYAREKEYQATNGTEEGQA
jgi:membrane-associated phospholipid phosphatase